MKVCSFICLTVCNNYKRPLHFSTTCQTAKNNKYLTCTAATVSQKPQDKTHFSTLERWLVTTHPLCIKCCRNHTNNSLSGPSNRNKYFGWQPSQCHMVATKQNASIITQLQTHLLLLFSSSTLNVHVRS